MRIAEFKKRSYNLVFLLFSNLAEESCDHEYVYEGQQAVFMELFERLKRYWRTGQVVYYMLVLQTHLSWFCHALKIGPLHSLFLFFTSEMSKMPLFQMVSIALDSRCPEVEHPKDLPSAESCFSKLFYYSLDLPEKADGWTKRTNILSVPSECRHCHVMMSQMR